MLSHPPTTRQSAAHADGSRGSEGALNVECIILDNLFYREQIAGPSQAEQLTAASVPPDDQVVGALGVAWRFEVHPNTQAPRPAATQFCSRTALIEDLNVARERIALGA